MPTRRAVLLAGSALIATPALTPSSWAQRRGHPAPRAGHGKPGQGQADAAQAGSPADTPIGPVDTTARWAYIMDFNTGATLMTKQGDDRVPPSSMTKLMTLYIVYSMLKSGRLKLTETFPVSEKAWRMGGSKMFVPLGGQVAVEDLIRGIVVDSGNDACIVLAEGISGSEEQFAELMNQNAKKLGLTNSHFVDCTGWPADDHYMSCHDIATLASAIIREFPDYYHYDSEKTFKYNNIEQGNRNTLVDKGIADGLKTGHTEAGGYGLVASAQRGNRRVVMVLNGMSTMRERSEEGERLLDWAFREFEDVTLFAAGDTVDNAKVWLGTRATVPLAGAQPVVLTMPRNWRQNAKVTVDYDAPIPAPIAKGQVLGKLTVAGQGVPNMEVPLVAAMDVPRLGLPSRALAVLSHYVTGS
jgi:serine-type D-Ala-D-Ala carboxypeptidase (penicillin-binding protein 5/6)